MAKRKKYPSYIKPLIKYFKRSEGRKLKKAELLEMLTPSRPSSNWEEFLDPKGLVRLPEKDTADQKREAVRVRIQQLAGDNLWHRHWEPTAWENKSLVKELEGLLESVRDLECVPISDFTSLTVPNEQLECSDA